LIYVTDLYLGIKVAIAKFANDARLGNIMKISEEDIDSLQEDIDRLV